MDEFRLHYAGAWIASVIPEVDYIYYEEYIGDMEISRARMIDKKTDTSWHLWNGVAFEGGLIVDFLPPSRFVAGNL